MSKTIYDDDSLQGDQLANIFVFHENYRAVMFDNPEECLLFKDDLDYEFEECEPKGDSMLEIESELPMLEEFSANTQITEGYTSLCLTMDKKKVFFQIRMKRVLVFLLLDLKTR